MTKVLLTGASGYIGKHIGVNVNKAQKLLDMKFIAVEKSLVETATYLIDNGFVKP